MIKELADLVYKDEYWKSINYIDNCEKYEACYSCGGDWYNIYINLPLTAEPYCDDCLHTGSQKVADKFSKMAAFQ